MYSYIIGKITERSENLITLENNGIGYELCVSTKAFDNLRDVDGETKIYTYYQQREDGVSLYGFYSIDEKEMFLKLISVNGVGPKGAIAILSNTSVSDLCVIIATQDANALSRVKGIGKKTAERLIVELKDKVNIVGNTVPLMGQIEVSSELNDAVEVLCSLGINHAEAMRLAKQNYEKGDKAESIIEKVLAHRG